MAKRKRLTPARMLDVAEAPATGLRPPIADVAQDAATNAAFAEVAAELTAARDEGRLIQRIPLDQIEVEYMRRDRIGFDQEEHEALIASITARGQQTPIEVTRVAPDHYALISGYRRIEAIRKIPELDTVLAIVRAPMEAADAYCAMVEENELRVDLSFYERARIVLHARKVSAFTSDKAALNGLFAHVPRARRSKIKSFMELVRTLDGALDHPEHISEKLGLALVKRMGEDPGFAPALREKLQMMRPFTKDEERTLLTRALMGPAKPKPPRPTPQPLRDGLEMLEHPDGRIELRGPLAQNPRFARILAEFLKDKTLI